MYEMASSYDSCEPAKALELLIKAAEMGSPAAECDLGRRYEIENGVPKDYAKAAFWYKKAADRDDGDAYASRKLGDFYESGTGVQQDWVAAARWYKAAADRYHKRYSKALCSLREIRPWDDE
jgi:TPR repeat protein